MSSLRPKAAQSCLASPEVPSLREQDHLKKNTRGEAKHAVGVDTPSEVTMPTALLVVDESNIGGSEDLGEDLPRSASHDAVATV